MRERTGSLAWLRKRRIRKRSKERKTLPGERKQAQVIPLYLRDQNLKRDTVLMSVCFGVDFFSLCLSGRQRNQVRDPSWTRDFLSLTTDPQKSGILWYKNGNGLLERIYASSSSYFPLNLFVARLFMTFKKKNEPSSFSQKTLLSLFELRNLIKYYNYCSVRGVV